MQKLTCYLAACLLFLLSACGNPAEEQKEALRQRIIEAFSLVEGDFALAFLPIDTPGDSILINPHESFHAASTMKTPVMIEAFRQVDAGKISLSDSITIKNQFYSIVDSSEYSLTVDQDSEGSLYGKMGDKILLDELIYEMIIRSSNLATNLVIELVGAKNTTATMRQLGAPNIEVLRGVEDIKAYRQGLSNTTTAYDLMMIYEKLAKDEAANPSSNQQMIDILLDQQFNEMIPAHLPEGVKVAHKTGWITGVHHDSGIVILPDGSQYVLVILSKNLQDEAKGVATIAQVSGWIYEYIRALKE